MNDRLVNTISVQLYQWRSNCSHSSKDSERETAFLSLSNSRKQGKGAWGGCDRVSSASASHAPVSTHASKGVSNKLAVESFATRSSQKKRKESVKKIVLFVSDVRKVKQKKGRCVTMNMHLYSLSVSLVLSGDDRRRTWCTFDSRKWWCYSLY